MNNLAKNSVKFALDGVIFRCSVLKKKRRRAFFQLQNCNEVLSEDFLEILEVKLRKISLHFLRQYVYRSSSACDVSISLNMEFFFVDRFLTCLKHFQETYACCCVLHTQ